MTKKFCWISENEWKFVFYRRKKTTRNLPGWCCFFDGCCGCCEGTELARWRIIEFKSFKILVIVCLSLSLVTSIFNFFNKWIICSSIFWSSRASVLSTVVGISPSWLMKSSSFTVRVLFHLKKQSIKQQ